MSNEKNTRRQFIASAAAVAAAAASMPAAAQAPAKPDATIEFTLWRAGFILGGSGGTGVLEFKGNGYHLNIGGISLGATVGVARAEFTGEVYNLKQARDIEGTYTAVGASGALAGGGGVAEGFGTADRIDGVDRPVRHAGGAPVLIGRGRLTPGRSRRIGSATRGARAPRATRTARRPSAPRRGRRPARVDWRGERTRSGA